MASTSIVPNLCLFCYKHIPSEYCNAQNTTKVNTFCAHLSRFLDCQNSNRMQTQQTTNSFNSCIDCQILTAEFSDVYHKIKCLELHLLWKLESLKKVMRMADRVPSRVALMKQYFENESISNIDNSESKLKAFRTFRKKIKKKCDNGRNLSRLQPRVSLKRFDQSVKLPGSQILQPSTPALLTLPAPLKSDSNFEAVREWSISFAVVLYLLIMFSNSRKTRKDWLISIIMDPSTDNGSDEIILDVKNSDKTSNVENIADDYLLECRSMDEIPQEPSKEAEPLYVYGTEQNTPTAQPKENIKREPFENENLQEGGNEFEDSCWTTFLSDEMQTAYKPVQVFDAPNCVQEAECSNTAGLGNDESSNCLEINAGHSNFSQGIEESNHVMYNTEKDGNILSSTTPMVPVVCKILNCTKIFETQEKLVKHQMFDIHQENVNTSCAPLETFICKECGMTTKLFDEFLKHVDSHKKPGDLQFRCLVCKKGFKRNYSLQNHIELHKNPAEWKYSCPTCGEKCATKKSLKGHIKLHSQDKSLKNQAFIMPRQPPGHAITSDSDKPWVCMYCGDTFALRQQCLNHALTKHRQISGQ